MESKNQVRKGVRNVSLLLTKLHEIGSHKAVQNQVTTIVESGKESEVESQIESEVMCCLLISLRLDLSCNETLPPWIGQLSS